MGFNKKSWVIVGIFVAIGLLYIFNGNITGEVVWEPITVVNNCSNINIQVLWDEIFKENSSGIEIFKEIPVAGENCTRFGARKGDGVDEIWNLYYSLSASGNIVADYANVTSGLYGDIMALSDVDGLEGVRATLASRLNEVNNYSMGDSGVALAYFKSKFKLTPEVLFYSSGTPLLYFSIESSSDGNWEYNITYSVFENESFAGIINRLNPFIEFIEDIPDFEFDKNSSWTDAFDISDHFNINAGIVVNFSSIGLNNTGGEWINYSIIDGEVSFNPAVNFVGYRTFKMVANNPSGNNVYSNEFNVTISLHNDAPVLRRNFENIGVPKNGGVNLFMGVYFNDSDGDNMTYGILGAEDLNITIDDDIITIRLKPSFNNTVRIRFYADDGRAETQSNYVYVYDLGDSEAVAFVDNATVNQTGDINTTAANTTGTTGNTSAGSVGSNGDEGGINWILWIIVIFVSLLLILFAIWFFFLKDGGVVANSSMPGGTAAPGAGGALGSPVDNYLKELNLSKGYAPSP